MNFFWVQVAIIPVPVWLHTGTQVKKFELTRAISDVENNGGFKYDRYSTVVAL